MNGRLGPFIFARSHRPTATQIAALGLINEMGAEKRISTPEAMVLLAAMAGATGSELGFTPEVLKVVRPQDLGAATAMREVSRS